MLARGRRPFLRKLACVWGVLQLVLPLLATFADARLEAASVGSASHVESTSTAACKPVHGDDCALCRFLSGARGPAPSQSALRPVAVALRPPSDVACGARAVRGRALPPSRAPPRS